MLLTPVGQATRAEIVREIHDTQRQIDAMNGRMALTSLALEREDLTEGLRIADRWLATLEDRLHDTPIETR